MARGRLVTIEGIDGAGKSTLAEALAHEIAGRGVTVELLREPGGVVVAERLRDLVKDATLEISPRAETLLYAAARAQLVHERLTPLLAEGTLVLLDRFVDSSLAYQGAGRGVGVEEVRAINTFATGGLTADRTLLLRIDPLAARARRRVRGQAPDRIERDREGFFATIAAAYEKLAGDQPERIRPIDAVQSRERVLDDALRAIEDLVTTTATATALPPASDARSRS